MKYRNKGYGSKTPCLTGATTQDGASYAWLQGEGGLFSSDARKPQEPVVT